MSIKTKLHLLAELMDIRSGSNRPLPAAQNVVVQKMLTASSYVVDKPVLDLLKRSDVMESISLIVKHDLARLPMNPMLVEYEPDVNFHHFVFLEEGQIDLARWADVPLEATCTINCWVGIMHRETGAAVVHENPIPVSVENGKLVLPDPDKMERYTSTYPLTDGRNLRKPDEIEELMITLAAADINVMAAAIAAQIAFLMLNTQGIEKEYIECHALNKARAKKNRTPIPSHHVVHIGRIYRRDDSSIATGHGGHAMPMHWRQAHTRRQHFGPREHDQIKIIFVPACIVNYDPVLPVPVVKKEIRV